MFTWCKSVIPMNLHCLMHTTIRKAQAVTRAFPYFLEKTFHERWKQQTCFAVHPDYEGRDICSWWRVTQMFTNGSTENGALHSIRQEELTVDGNYWCGSMVKLQGFEQLVKKLNARYTPCKKYIKTLKWNVTTPEQLQGSVLQCYYGVSLYFYLQFSGKIPMLHFGLDLTYAVSLLWHYSAGTASSLC